MRPHHGVLIGLCVCAVAGGGRRETGRHTVDLRLLPVLAAEHPSPGREAHPQFPSLTLPDLAGQRQALRAAPDEVTVVNFWATWCVPCLKELPELVALHHQWRPHGVRVVGIAIDSGAPVDVRTFAARYGMDYTLLLATQQWARTHFGLFGLPVTLVVDRQGQIRQRLLGPQTGAQFEAAMRPYL